MGRWTRGESTVEKLIRDRHLDRVSGASTDGHSWLDDAESTLRSAEAVVAVKAKSAYILAYDAARGALTALLVQQGLRPTSKGGHYCVVEAVSAQFGAVFNQFDWMRRRRNDLEYPPRPAEATVTHDEALAAIRDAGEIVNSARKIIDQLGFFG